MSESSVCVTYIVHQTRQEVIKIKIKENEKFEAVALIKRCVRDCVGR